MKTIRSKIYNQGPALKTPLRFLSFLEEHGILNEYIDILESNGLLSYFLKGKIPSSQYFAVVEMDALTSPFQELEEAWYGD